MTTVYGLVALSLLLHLFKPPFRRWAQGPGSLAGLSAAIVYFLLSFGALLFFIAGATLALMEALHYVL
ncbi:MAG: hypothetical protein U0350_36450 [Caldilineaceae bacterium]